jgi:hypothetical protein
MDNIVRGFKIVNRTEPDLFVIFGIAMFPSTMLFIIRPLLFYMIG